MKEKKGKDRLGGILALILLVCTIFHSGAFALAADIKVPDHEVPIWQTMGIKKVLEYSQDKSSALVGVDLTEMDTEQYQVKQIQEPDKGVLELNDPVITAAFNDIYTFEITYIDLKDKEEKEQSVQLSVEVDGIETEVEEIADSEKQQEEAKAEEQPKEEESEEAKKEEQTEEKNVLNTEHTTETPAAYVDESPEARTEEESYFHGIRYAYVKNTEDPYIKNLDYIKRICWKVEGEPDKVTLEIFDVSKLIVGPVDVTGEESYEIRADLLSGIGVLYDKYRYLNKNGINATYRLTAQKGKYKQIFRGAFGFSEISYRFGETITRPDSIMYHEPMYVLTAAPAVTINSLKKNDDVLNINWQTGSFEIGKVPSGDWPMALAAVGDETLGPQGANATNKIPHGMYTYNHGGVAENQAALPRTYSNNLWTLNAAEWTNVEFQEVPIGTTSEMNNSVQLKQGYNTIDMGAHAKIAVHYYPNVLGDHIVLSTYFDQLRLTYYEGNYCFLSYDPNYPQAATATSGTVPEDDTLYEQEKTPVVAGYGDLAAEGAGGITYEIVGWSRTAQEPSENPTPEFKVKDKYHTQNYSGGITKHGTLYAVWKMTLPPTNEVTVKKTVAGDTERKDFAFEVKLTTEDGSAYDGAVEYTTGSETKTITGGVGTITLKNDGIFKMKVPETVYYQVTEKDYISEGAKTTVSVDGGKETESLTSERRKSAVEAIAFTNTYPKRYDFTIQEIITGSGADMKRDFSVKVSFYDRDGKELTGFDYAGTKGAATSDGSDSGTTAAGGVMLTMPHDSAMVFKGIPEGTDCKIVLDDGEDFYTYYVDGTIDSNGMVTGGVAAEADGSYKVTVSKDKTQVQTIHYKEIMVPTGRNNIAGDNLSFMILIGMAVLVIAASVVWHNKKVV